LLLSAVQAVEAEKLHFLVVGADRLLPPALVANEIATLRAAAQRAGVRNRVALLTGSDHLAALLVGRALLWHCGLAPSVEPAYASPSSAQDIPNREHLSLAEVVAAHLEALGLQQGQDGGDLTFVVSAGDLGRAQSALEQRAHDLLNSGAVCAVADAGQVANGATLLARLEIKPSMLVNVAGWAALESTAESTGIALAQAAGRLCALQQSQSSEIPEQEQRSRALGHLRLLFGSLLEGYFYRGVVRPAVERALHAIDRHLPANLGALRASVEERVQNALAPLAADLFAASFRGADLAQVLPGARGRLSHLGGLEARLPWGRTAEVELRFSLETD